MLNPDEFHLISDKHRLDRDVWQAFKAMHHAAKGDGISIDIASSYRSEERQLAIWNAKWRGERPLYDRKNQLIDPETLSDIEKMHSILIYSALPGASRHHWGTDLDVYDKPALDKVGQSLELIESEYSEGGPCHPLHQWLQKHASHYGFYFPYLEDVGGVAKEPWHISHKPLADQCLQELTLSELERKIKTMIILGKGIILDNLDEIYHRYVLNEGD